ncbi:MarR family winged helix-turn-helix transcriptional regulator [Effusibacillus dendaii]|uniref:HTH marR-type domain-containing protein n=1 Tax=Effusibacillus dendaii TaxID=2743772 RepID=A0A7I8DF32_9BACL|nr:MarR family transcriptional regulator [Effusibacillus dendaii]BCJ87559.1 hypothetical protein skT53_25440 [Effusibacillus dendaii]
MPDKNTEPLEQFLISLQSVNRYLRSGMLDGQESFPITRVQWLILRHIWRSRKRTIGELASHLNVRSSTMSQMIDRLEKSGLVYRSTDTADTRIKIIRLTDKGNETIRHVESMWLSALVEPFEKLSREERTHLVQLMRKLSDAIPKRGENQ